MNNKSATKTQSHFDPGAELYVLRHTERVANFNDEIKPKTDLTPNYNFKKRVFSFCDLR